MGGAFVALTSVSFSTLPAELRTAASSIGGLIRNIGGSIGITAMIAFLQHDSQVNHATISAHVTPFSRMLQQGAAERLWNPNHIGGATTLDGLIQHQAILIAYLNDFHRTMLLALCGVPLLLLLRPLPPMGRTATSVAVE
jgi:DHA2 family multidrug resistance protein